jgi:mannose-6-phosphate isomerase-like protein (cupin superfamily)
MTEIDRRALTLAFAAAAAGGSASGAGGSAGAANAPPIKTGRFDIDAIAGAFPETADTLLVDQYLTDRAASSARVFRIYKPVPPHFHRQCDEYLYVVSGRGTFWMGDASTEAAFGPGELLFFERGTVHALPELIEQPVVFLSVDAPRRDPADVTFVNPDDGAADGFVRQLKPEPY